MKNLLIIFIVIMSLIYMSNSIAKPNNNGEFCNKNNIVANNFKSVLPVALPISSRSKLKKENTISFSRFSDSFLQNLSDNHGDFLPFGGAIRLPDICNKTVFIAYFTDEGELENYSLNVFKDGKGHSVNFGTGSEFWIDKKYNIKVKSYDGKLIKINYYKISDSGVIMRGEAPFN
ncbi:MULTISPECIES: hypothetical protein [Acinetobacter]|jgi:hypothetical protein|uniref:hypothetical protein n=1 Tax=Acinetobacter TaxID=469 RepID=UPI0022E88A97|nr:MULTISPECIES: hypothetical protein [Acinetobacter]MDI1221949.1 hypothetical protein [Acinetobacter sp.]